MYCWELNTGRRAKLGGPGPGPDLEGRQMPPIYGPVQVQASDSPVGSVQGDQVGEQRVTTLCTPPTPLLYPGLEEERPAAVPSDGSQAQ